MPNHKCSQGCLRSSCAAGTFPSGWRRGNSMEATGNARKAQCMIFCGKASLYLGAPVSSAHSKGCSVPPLSAGVLATNLSTVRSQSCVKFTGFGLNPAFQWERSYFSYPQNTQKAKPQTPTSLFAIIQAQIRARIPAAIPIFHQHQVGTGSKATTPRLRQQL